MLSIFDFQKKYHQKIDSLDLDILIASAIKKPREFVLTHPEYKIPAARNLKLETFIQRRLRNEPLAYILGRKEFSGLEFKVDKNVLIPRPETEQLVELASYNIKHGTWNRKNKLFIIDVGTGSGNIIISIAKTIENLKSQISNLKFIGIDISQKALNIAQQNTKKHNLSKKINFLHGDLMTPIIQNSKFKIQNSIILANLPYLSSQIYNSAPKDVKNYEPKSALLSSDNGLNHYQRLFKQIKKLRVISCKLQVFLEISPEQKFPLKKAIQTAFPGCRLTFFKDLAGKFRTVRINIPANSK